jgi:hypothetical protein
MPDRAGGLSSVTSTQSSYREPRRIATSNLACHLGRDMGQTDPRGEPPQLSEIGQSSQNVTKGMGTQSCPPIGCVCFHIGDWPYIAQYPHSKGGLSHGPEDGRSHLVEWITTKAARFSRAKSGSPGRRPDTACYPRRERHHRSGGHGGGAGTSCGVGRAPSCLEGARPIESRPRNHPLTLHAGEQMELSTKPSCCPVSSPLWSLRSGKLDSLSTMETFHCRSQEDDTVCQPWQRSTLSHARPGLEN